MDVELLESKPSSEPHAAPAPSAKPPANGTNGAPVSAPQANGNIPVDSDSEDDVPLSKRIVTPAAKPRPGEDSLRSKLKVPVHHILYRHLLSRTLVGNRT